MRVETGLAGPAVSKRAAPIALACALALTGFACPADAAVTGASAGHAPSASIAAAAETAAATDAPIARAPRDGGGAGGSAAAVAFEEQSLPPEDSGISGGISGSVTRAARRLA